MVDLFKKKGKATNTPSSSTSEENAEMLPNDKKSKSELATKKTNIILLFIAFVMLGIFVLGAIITANQTNKKIETIEQTPSTPAQTKKEITQNVTSILY